MAIAGRLKRHLEDAGIAPDVLVHAPTPSAMRAAQAGGVSGRRVAKAVLLRDADGYLLAVLPASHHIGLETLARLTGRPLELATEEEVAAAFPDCEVGALPAIGAAYGLPVIVDDSLAGEPELYVEGGDHRSLVRLTQEQFGSLVEGARHGSFGHPG